MKLEKLFMFLYCLCYQTTYFTKEKQLCYYL